MFENRLGFMASLALDAMPPANVVSGLAQLGYNAVEWTRSFNPRDRTMAELRNIVEVTANAGLAISEVVIQQDYVCLDEGGRHERIMKTCETIQACAELGIDTVNLFTGPAPWDPQAPRVSRDVSHESAWQMVCEAFGKIVPVLESCQVHGAVEGVWGHLCNDYFTTRPLIDLFSSDYLGVNFDPSHDVLKGNLDTGWLVKQWGKRRVKHVHLKDAAGIPEPGRFLFPFPGEGHVDWKGMFAALAEIAYGGYLSVEFESFAYHDRVLRGDTLEAARRCLADVRALLQV